MTTQENGVKRNTGHLIINADDWGRDRENTDRILECVVVGAVSSVSAMVFMADSERAAATSRDRKIDAGLHLNLTSPFLAGQCSASLLEEQRKIVQYLCGNRLAQAIFHPGLTNAYRHVVDAQLEEYQRLYGGPPRRIDGHHHMHLSANVIWGGLLPGGTVVRRNFSFQPGEKSWFNRLYRQAVDRKLSRRHHLTDYFFSIVPMDEPGRLERIFSFGRKYIVEVETHPVNVDEYRFLAGGEIFERLGDVPIVPFLSFSSERFGPSQE